MNKYCIYCRVSGEPTEDNIKAMEAQAALLHREAEDSGLDVVDEIQVYESAETGKGEGIRTLIQGAEQGKYNCVLAVSLSRIFRNTVDALEVAEKFKQCDLDLYTLREGFVLHTPGSISVLAQIASVGDPLSKEELNEAEQILRERGYDSDEIDEIISDCYSDMQEECYSKPFSWYIDQTEAKQMQQEFL